MSKTKRKYQGLKIQPSGEVHSYCLNNKGMPIEATRKVVGSKTQEISLEEVMQHQGRCIDLAGYRTVNSDSLFSHG
jgi:hypothetical protein